MLALLISSLLLVPRLLVLVAPGDAETKVSLPDGRVVWFAGEWTRRDTLWEDAAVVYRADGRALYALDGGSAEPRQVKAYPHKYWASTSGPTWSADGSTLYFWFDVDEQLVAMDRETGSRTSLTALGSHVINEKGNKHLDPHPVFRRDGLEEDVANGMLLFLLDEEENDEVPFWERRAGRGGTSLVGIDVADGAMTELIPKRVLPDVILSWDISLARGRLYLVSKPHVRYRPGEPHALEEWRLNGKKVRALPEVEGTAGDVHLSPDERLLLVERAYKPGKPIPDLALDDYTRADHDVLFEAKEGGFVLIDLETGDVADGPASGCETAWAPDGQRILYVDGWDVNVFDRQTGDTTKLIEGGPQARDWYWHTWHEPVWSADGRRIALTAGSRGTLLLLDLAAREYFVYAVDANGKTWAPSPRPFPEPREDAQGDEREGAGPVDR